MHISSDDLIAALRIEGLRITNARRAICQVLASSHGEHLTANDIYDKARAETGTNLDRSTVYRTLEALEKADLLRHGHLGHSPTVYHLSDEPHHQHLVCETCGATFALAEVDLEAVTAEITARTGFVPDVDHFALSGRCADCARSPEPPRERR